MSASPFLNPLNLRSRRSVRSMKGAWLPVLFSLIFVRCTSTSLMSGSHTQVLVNAAWLSVLGRWHFELAGFFNVLARKIGHFFGYGTIGLLFHRAWYCSARPIAWVRRTWLMPFATSLSVASTFFVASLDEWHQRFLPGRVGCLRDVLIDTTGALFLTTLFLAVRTLYYRDLLYRRQLYYEAYAAGPLASFPARPSWCRWLIP